MTPSPFGAARPRVAIRPRGDVRPLRRDHPDDAAAASADDRASEAERFAAAERMREMSDNGSWPTDAQLDAYLYARASRRGVGVVALPVDERGAGRAAA